MKSKKTASISLIISLSYNLIKIVNLIWKPIVLFLNKNKIKDQYKEAEKANNENDINKINDILKS